MNLQEDELHLAASDIANHLACHHLTALDLAVARHERGKPRPSVDPHLEVLRRRGMEHEQAFLDRLRAQGLSVEEVPDVELAQAAHLTLDAMARGVDVIAQATLVAGRWNGRADVLRRVEQPSPLCAWSWRYEPYDTKLAQQTRAGTILQLCLYADLLERLQGVPPEFMHVVTPVSQESYRVEEYAAYYRRVQASLAGQVDAGINAPATYPLPCAHCDICRWALECNRRRRDDDHLCLVAGMRRSAERELAVVEVGTLARLAGWMPPAEWRPERGMRNSYETLHHQARVQLASRGEAVPVHELLPVAAGQGLARLPESSSGDLFLDLEGDAFFGEGGLEYLFGVASVGEGGQTECRAWWALDRASERRGFEAVMDLVKERLERDPDLHVFHYGHYEPTAFKRLACRHGTRVEQLDQLLRAKRFVDLHQVVRQGVRAGVESYSIKRLEALYGFVRDANLPEAGRVRAELEAALELGRAGEVTPADRELVELYNRDDCCSTRLLRDWLEARREELVSRGIEVPRPAPGGEGEAAEELGERLAHVRAVADRLLAALPVGREDRDVALQARWLLAHSLEFHRREANVGWWEFYRLADLDERDRLEEPATIAGLRFDRRIPAAGRGKLPTDRYTFPPQEVDNRARTAHVSDELTLGEVVELDAAGGWVEIKKTGESVDVHPSSVFLHEQVRAVPKDGSLLRLGEWVADHGIDAPGLGRAGRGLLLREPPRGCEVQGGDLRRPGEEHVAAARRLVLELDGGVLPIQGPPGAGKTYTGARIIVELVRQRKKVGISALSHKVIRKLLDEVVAAASEEHVPVRCLVKVREVPDGARSMPSRGRGKDRVEDPPLEPGITETADNKDVERALASGAAQVVAGTAWLWSRESLEDSLDVLIVDEAGQMALADVLAMAPAARNLVLLGDPQQLEQPIQGAHPDGCEVAALGHLLGGEPTVAPDRGLFIEHTRRMHPDVCRFTSEQFYDGKLRSLPGLERQALHAPPPFDACGLYWLPVEHEGRQNASEEEADAIAVLVSGWLSACAAWTDRNGVRRQLTLDDVLIVAPYNAQLALLKARLPGGRIGTVDKFQGQEAPVVIYSLTTSSQEEAPRGMEFLYSRNRLNVATSRAQCACVMVASPRLLEPACRTPRHMRLANALCRYVEMAVRSPATG